MKAWMECWLNLKDENIPEFLRLARILKNTNKVRIKKKIGKRIFKLCMKK